MSYTLEIARSAEREIHRLPGAVQSRVLRVVSGLQEEPRPPGCKKLIGADDLWRIRIGAYRVIYLIDDGIKLVRVERAGHRSDIYR